MRTVRDAGILIMMIAMVSVIAIVGGISGTSESASLHDVAADASRPATSLIAARTRSSGSASSRGRSVSGLSLMSPADQTRIDSLDGQTLMSWWFSGGYEPGAFELRRGATVVEHVDLWNDVSVAINNSYLRAGTYDWCVSVFETVDYQQTGEACRKVVRVPAHRARLSSVVWRSSNGTFSGYVSSTVPKVRVKVIIKKGAEVVSASSWISVKTLEHGADSRFSYGAPIHADTKTKRLAAFITVSGGGMTQVFRNDLVNRSV